jgi:hypothetical protein
MLGSTGFACPANYCPEAYPDIARKQTVVAFAGPIAEVRSRGDLNFAEALGDFADVLECVEALPDRIDLVECEAEARRIVDQDWAGIVRVACALRTSAEGRLEAESVVGLLTGASGGLP